jgi:hypothetical protein
MRSGPMSPEATTAGDTEHTRIPDGPRKSAIPWEIPMTAAAIVSSLHRVADLLLLGP